MWNVYENGQRKGNAAPWTNKHKRKEKREEKGWSHISSHIPVAGIVTIGGYDCKWVRRGVTLHTSLVKFNPDSVSGEKKIEHEQLGRVCQHKTPHFCRGIASYMG